MFQHRECQRLPCRFQNHINAFSGVCDKVSEDDGEALEGVLLDVEEGLGVGLDDLEEQPHPGVERLAQALLHQLIVDPIRPRYCPQAQIQYFEYLFSTVGVYLFVGEGGKQGGEELGDELIELLDRQLVLQSVNEEHQRPEREVNLSVIATIQKFKEFLMRKEGIKGREETYLDRWSASISS